MALQDHVANALLFVRSTSDAVLVIGPILSDPLPDPAPYGMTAPVSNKRRREFLTGRLYAEFALNRLRCAKPGIGLNPDRSPVWPPGFCGSISHSDNLCAVVAARTARVQAIGLDLERTGSLSPDLADVVCHLDDKLNGSDPTLIFAAKEAFYKLWSPMTGVFLDFADVGIVARPGMSVEARLLKHQNLRPGLAPLTGQAALVAGHLIVLFVLPVAGADPALDPLTLLHQPF